MKRVISLPLMIVLLLSFATFAESADSTEQGVKKATAEKKETSVRAPRKIDEAGNWSKIKSLFL